MTITYTTTKLEIECHPEELVVGRREARDAVLLTQEHIDDGFHPPSMEIGDELAPAISAEDATEGFVVPARQFMTHLNVEYTGTDDDTGVSASFEERVPLTHWDDIVEADFVAFSDVTEAWVNSRVATWVEEVKVEEIIARMIAEKNEEAVTVAKPWE
tara:strand:- start:482 stop:955 length:474 start_codon:yes stop_codon:yes gene_type:complete